MELKGKHIAFLGDSITEGHGVSDRMNRYDNALLRKASLAAVYNYGVGGTRIAYQHTPSECAKYDYYFAARAHFITPLADVIVVFGGTNDFGHGDAPFGADTDTTPTTFLGAVNRLMDFLRTSHPTATIVFLTPARREDDENPALNPAHAAQNLTLKSYVDGIKACAVAHSIPVLDLYGTFPVNPNNPADKAAYTTDGLHLNDAAHLLLADHLAAFLETL